MNTFQKARLKFTAWYLLIITLLSLLFSIFIYTGISYEFQRIESLQHFRQKHPDVRLPDSDTAFPGHRSIEGPISQMESRIKSRLVVLNAMILVIAGATAFVLAGRTLKPIRVMMDEQDRFIADASHELKTPLTAIRSEIEVNLMNKELTLEEARGLLESNLEEVIILQNLSESLTKLARYQKVTELGKFSEVSLLDVVENALRKIVPLARKKNIAIHNNIEDTTILGDKQTLTELFTILLDNAVKYSADHTSVILDSSVADHLATVRIIDQGIGIDERDLPHIFDRFYRADKSRSKSDVAGYGLGLSIAKHIMETHKGTISIRSELGKGTTITIQLPIIGI